MPKARISFSGTFTWSAKFVFSANNGKLDIQLKYNEDPIDYWQDSSKYPKGDGDPVISYDPKPKDDMDGALNPPQTDFETTLEAMKKMFLNEWVSTL